jgi:hypothetical protein
MEPIVLDGNQRAKILAMLIILKSTLPRVGAVWSKDAQAMLELLRDAK